jgi:hypothetical protein
MRHDPGFMGVTPGDISPAAASSYVVTDHTERMVFRAPKWIDLEEFESFLYDCQRLDFTVRANRTSAMARFNAMLFSPYVRLGKVYTTRRADNDGWVSLLDSDWPSKLATLQTLLMGRSTGKGARTQDEGMGDDPMLSWSKQLQTMVDQLLKGDGVYYADRFDRRFHWTPAAPRT